MFGDINEIHTLNRSQFKELLELASLDNHFIFDGTIYKQIDKMAMGSPLGPTLAMALMCYMEEKWLSDCPRLMLRSLLEENVLSLMLPRLQVVQVAIRTWNI